MKELSYRRERFVGNYLDTGSATEAAVMAHYAPKHAAQTACRLLKEPAVQARITELRQRAHDELSERLPDRIDAMADGISLKLSAFLRIDPETGGVRFLRPSDLTIADIQNLTQREDGALMLNRGDGSPAVTFRTDDAGDTVSIEFADMSAVLNELLSRPEAAVYASD